MSFLPAGAALRGLSLPGPSRLALRPCRCLSTSAPTLSGSNRWSKIRHKKGAADQVRGELFAKLSKEIANAMRPPASSDPALNSRLATALARAKEQGLTKSGIENAMAKAKAKADGTGQSVMYEALTPGGKVALLIECRTDNTARVNGRIREVLTRNGGRVSPVAFMFEKKGMVTLFPNGSAAGFEHLFDLAVDAGAEDVREAEGDDGEGSVVFEVITPPTSLGSVTTALCASPEYTLDCSELVYIPTEPVRILSDGEEGDGISEGAAEAVIRLVDLLEAENEVERVTTNME
ncbi:hypothetical protein IAT38_002267 [Cryptococcus sp. DSM 104549]